MPLIDLLTSQLTDLFRIGLIIALVITTARNQAVTGNVIPLIAGVVFVAIIIPATMQTAATDPLWRLAGVGVVANLIILAGVLAIRAVILRARR
jgi:formate-dependent nitrite reductase membrane component NrfD